MADLPAHYAHAERSTAICRVEGCDETELPPGLDFDPVPYVSVTKA